MNTTFEVEPLAPAIGAEVRGLDLAQPIPPATLARLRATWLARKVLVFRGAVLTPDQHLAFARQFGELDKYPFLKGIDGYPLIAPVLKLPHETVNFGGIWHSDTSYLERPAAGAVLHALELPPVGGDTLFANMATAWATLPAGLRAVVQGLRAVCSSTRADVSRTREDRLRDSADPDSPAAFENVHPVVRTHPATGEQVLYVNEAHVSRFDGWTEADSAPLLRQLYDHQRRPEHQCRVRWQVGTVVLWDNRATQHYPINDYHGHRRLLHRVSLAGEVPV